VEEFASDMGQSARSVTMTDAPIGSCVEESVLGMGQNKSPRIAAMTDALIRSCVEESVLGMGQGARSVERGVIMR